MIIAIVILDRIQPQLDNKDPYFLTLGTETVLERVARTVLRGPFAGTIIASDAAFSARAKETLDGFAVQHVEAATPDLIQSALKQADSFRQRWKKAMAAAKARFGDSSTAEKKSSTRKDDKTARKEDWDKHKGDPDVKLRGLARSFDRDGVMLFRANQPLLTIEFQAQLIENFAREGVDKGSAARPFTQAVYEGERGYPMLIDFENVAEVTALPPATDFSKWLLQHLDRVKDVNGDKAQGLQLRSDADYREACLRLKVKPAL